MSISIVWQIDAHTIEDAIKDQLGLDNDVSVWGAVYDRVNHGVGVVLDINDDDMDKIVVNDLEWHQLEEVEELQ